jgi:hypothetical protein
MGEGAIRCAAGGRVPMAGVFIQKNPPPSIFATALSSVSADQQLASHQCKHGGARNSGFRRDLAFGACMIATLNLPSASPWLRPFACMQEMP